MIELDSVLVADLEKARAIYEAAYEEAEQDAKDNNTSRSKRWLEACALGAVYRSGMREGIIQENQRQARKNKRLID